MDTMWKAFENGESIGQEGSESGIIVLDEEHDLGARITLERDTSHAPWAVTCGIYGSFMHTAFASSKEEAARKFEMMKPDLVLIMTTDSDDARYGIMRRVAETY